MPQKISISRWNIGEVSQKAIGDFEDPLYNTSCRFLRNFVVSETGKLWRRPGFEHHLIVTQNDPYIVCYYLRDQTLVFIFYVDGDMTTGILKADWYALEDTGGPKKSFQLKGTIELSTFSPEDFTQDRPKTFNIKRISTVQVDNFLYVTHPNMKDPYEIEFLPTFDFTSRNFSESDRSYYTDIWYDDTVDAEKWNKTYQTDLNIGGGVADDNGPAGWTAYTGKKFNDTEENQGKNDTPAQTFKYLSTVTFAFERLIWAVGPRVHGSGGGDPLNVGIQYNSSIPNDIVIDPYTIISSDPFLYRASSDLGYEEFKWLLGGPMLMGGANNGAWVLSHPESGLDTLNPLMYKATSNGAHWVPGKTIGDAMIYFQRPGRQLNEFLFANTSQNYVATNLTEYSDHLFFDNIPTEMHVQRSPFNLALILKDNGDLVTFTYDRQKQITAWAQHPFSKETNPNVNDEEEKILTMGIYSDGEIDQPVVITKRTNANGTYQALELMDLYTPNAIGGIFVDAAEIQKLDGDFEITDIQEDPNGHWLYYSGTPFTVGQKVKFVNAVRTDDGVQDILSTNYDYIYKVWTVLEVDTGRIRIADDTGEPYIGIFLKASETITENAYIHYGKVRHVTSDPLPGSTLFNHLSGITCKAMLDNTPYGVYVSIDATKFYKEDSIPEDWEGDESELEPLNIYWNDIVIGRKYDSLFSPLVLKKQIHKGKINRIELEVFRSLGGKVGIGRVSLENDIEFIKTIDLTFPVSYEEGKLYTGTLKPQIVGGFEDDPLWFILVDEAVPFNITNIIYILGAN